MNNVCPNPDCGAVYQINPQHVGRRLTCKKCAAPLLVTDGGLQIEGSAASPAVLAEPARPAAPAGPGAWALFRDRLRAIADPPTWLFGSGAFLVILYLFLPLIDQAKVRRREALVIVGEVREARLEADFKKKEKTTDEEKTRRQQQKEAWEREKNYLEDDVEAAEIGQRRATYWYRYGALLGFLLLAFGSLGYLDPRQPTVRRILGCVVLVALLLSIFNGFAGLGIRIDIGGR
jgi:hypothetical protein